MAQFKLTPMEFMRKYCKHELDFTQPISSVMVIAASRAPEVKVNAKVA